MNLLAELKARFEAALSGLTSEPKKYAEMVRVAQDPRFGDFQANCAMPLAKERKANPRELASEIIERLDVADLCVEPEPAGPGFINLSLRNDWLVDQTNMLLRDERLGVEPAAQPRTIVIDFSAPNVAKPMHVGHLRSTVIGDALCRILKTLGHRVIGDNHIGDWGTQFGMIIFGYKHFLDPAAFEADSVGELARMYRLVNQLSDYHQAKRDVPELRAKVDLKCQELETAESAPAAKEKSAKKALKKQRTELESLRTAVAQAEKKLAAVENDSPLKALADAHPNIAEEARNETALLHSGDAENRELWDRFLPACLEALEAVYERLDIKFDRSLGESFYQPMLADVVEDLSQRGIAQPSEGATCIFLEQNDAPFIVRKSDGAFTYATTDLATIKYRVEELQADLILYVVDARQSEHFQLLFGAAAKWGFDRVELRHIPFGTVLGDDRRPFKTRAGDTVGLESLLDESIRRARAVVDENDDAKTDSAGQPTPELDEAARSEVAQAVAIGGVKYADLNHNRESDYVFSWEKMLAKNGDTATYIQYSAARINGIFRRGDIDRVELRKSAGKFTITAPAERALALQLNRFVEELEAAAVDFRPNIVTSYLFETANRFGAFYEKCSVLKEEDPAVRSSRLLLCDLTSRVLERGLQLLGIRTCERM